MNFKVDLDTQKKMVKVEVDGPLDNAIRKKILSSIAAQMKSNNFNRAIVDLRRSHFNLSEPMKGSVELTMYLSDIGMSPDAKLAFIYDDAETHRKTFEKISQKIGYQLRYFKDIDDAYNWLSRP